MARVERGDEPLDRAALAARVPALEEHAHGRADPALADEPAEHEAQRQQPDLRRLEALRRLLLGELDREVDVVEASHLPGSYHGSLGTVFNAPGFNESTRPWNTVGASPGAREGDPHGIRWPIWTRRSLLQRTNATCATSSLQASSGPPSSGTTSSSTGPPPRWSSTSCSSPTPSPSSGRLAALGTYAVGFAARPLGGVVFGHFGDRVGRKSMLVLSLLIMGLATFLIGCLPTHASIGVAAPVLLVAAALRAGHRRRRRVGRRGADVRRARAEGQARPLRRVPADGRPRRPAAVDARVHADAERDHRGPVHGLGLARPVPRLDRARGRRPGRSA